jgi:hypothetical protein
MESPLNYSWKLEMKDTKSQAKLDHLLKDNLKFIAKKYFAPMMVLAVIMITVSVVRIVFF